MTEPGLAAAPEAIEAMDGANGAMLVIISGPSGVGKDTIIDALRRRHHDPEYHYVVTCTTRAARPGEVDGVDYHFLDAATFGNWQGLYIPEGLKPESKFRRGDPNNPADWAAASFEGEILQ